MERKAILTLMLAFAAVQAEEAAKAYTVEVPAYTVTEHGGTHYIDIEGGAKLNREEGRPQVPYLREAVEYPRGYRVRNVVLKEVAEPESTRGLKLPVVRLDPYREDPLPMTRGYYPRDQYEWNVLEEPDRGQLLNLYVYPVHYLPGKELVVFYPRFEFEMDVAATTVSIDGIRTDKPTYDPGDEVMLELVLANTGEEQDVSVEARLRRTTGSKPVPDLKAMRLSLGGHDTVRLIWSSSKQEPGEYEFEASVLDSRRQELDRAQTWFRLGRPQAEVIGFKADPEQFKVGDDVKVEFVLKNTGTCKLSGEAVLEIKAGDSLVTRSAQAFEGLAVGGTRRFSESWKTEDAEEGVVYEVVAYAGYEGTATLAERAEVSTNARPVASFTFEPESIVVGQEAAFDGSGSQDPDGEIASYAWEFGDGAEAKGESVTHTYQQSGSYVVGLTVTDTGGRAATAEQTVSVTE